MGSQNGADAALSADWLGLSRQAAAAIRRALADYPRYADRARETGRGEGGDMTLAIDRAAEDAVLAEIERLGTGVTVVSEERGLLEVGGGGPVVVVVDPIDGSLNAKRGLPPYSFSLAVADGPTMGDVRFGYVANLAGSAEWWADTGGGAFCGGTQLALPPEPELEILGVESARPEAVAAVADALVATGARRLRMVGSIAVSLCQVASGSFDALVTLRNSRSVDAAAGQLIVREAGGVVSFPDAADAALGASLMLDMRSRVAAAAAPALLERLGALALPVPG